MTELSFDCIYCGPGFTVGPVVTHDATTASETEWRQWWKEHGPPNNTDLLCPCGALHRLVDDGVTATEGGGLDAANTSSPKLTSLDVVTGPEAGGTTVVITGDFLEVGTLAVKFGGVDATNMASRTKTSVAVDTPAGVAGAVDVVVENEFGVRVGGASVLVGGFTYV